MLFSIPAHYPSVLNSVLSVLNLADLRKNYALQSLAETDVQSDPIAQFSVWFQNAVDSQVLEPNAMALATATADGLPSIRTVLLKGFDSQGFTFYTNYESRKGNELLENPQAALLFTWLELERQIRIEGTVEKVSEDTSLQYFQSRPKGSQIGAWASPQSHVISDRSVLELREQTLQAQYADVEKLPLPPFWGGYNLRPNRIEFWQGRSSRLHDRICYTLENGAWKIVRLAP